VQALARTYTETAVLTLVRCLDDPRHAVSAAIALLDRGWGRPSQPIGGDEERGPINYSFSWAATPPEAGAPVIEAQEAATDDARSDAQPLTLTWQRDD
jgi:hypothetical protein